MRFVFLLIPYSIVLLLSFFTTNNVFFEFIASFAPYFLVINLFLLTGIFLLLFFHGKRTPVTRLFGISVIFLCVTSFAMSLWISDYVFAKRIQHKAEKPLKILFLNMHFRNTKYEEINTLIKNSNADIVGISEVGDVSKISLSKEYPYSQIKITRIFETLALYSKYPLSTPQKNSYTENAVVAMVTIGNKQYPIIVTHPYPPVNQEKLLARNEELFKLSSYINYFGGRAIFMGDFNISPWSYTFRELLTSIPKMQDTAKGHGVHLTWGMSFIRTKIDYILVPKAFRVEEFYSQPVPGSDHRLIWTMVKI